MYGEANVPPLPPDAPCPCGDPVAGPPCTPDRPCPYAEGMPRDRWDVAEPEGFLAVLREMPPHRRTLVSATIIQFTVEMMEWGEAQLFGRFRAGEQVRGTVQAEADRITERHRLRGEDCPSFVAVETDGGRSYALVPRVG